MPERVDIKMRIENDFAYHAPDQGKAERHAVIRELCRSLAVQINDLTPQSREQSIALTHLEEAMFWANAAIARND